MAEDYYKILGLAPGASKAQIRQAYHELAKRYHPDRAHGDAEAEKQFLAINEAYQALSDNALIYYQILEVSRTTSLSDIKRAYSRLCEKYHPGVRAGDKATLARMKEIKQAYEILAGKEDTANSGGDNDW